MSDKDGKDAICVNDPNYAIICKFLQKFAVLCNITTIDTIILQKQIENTDEVPTELFDLLVKLLRKNKYTVHLERWERAVIKFCYTYSNQDAWEIERFGYKKSKCAVKLRVLKSLLEAQFDINNKFKAAINAIPANELRSSPLGRDKYGNSYWSTLDEGCNLKIYQEHLDEETWHLVASTRDELCNLIERLKGNEKIGPSLVGIVDEDSSSINSVNSKNDGEELVKLDSENHIKDGEKNHIECDESNKNENDNASDMICTENDVKKGDNKSKDDSSVQTTRLLLLASKPPSKKKTEIKLKSNVTESQTNESKKFKPNNSSSEEEESDEETEKVKDKNVSSSGEEGEEEDDEEEAEEEEEDDDDDVEGEDSDDDEIEEPIQHVIGEGSGKDNNAFNPGYFEDDLPEFSEIVEEETFYTFGEGNGSECLVGNSDSNESCSNSSSKKPMFFFGQPGCLKLSPTKSSSSSTDSIKEKSQTSRNKKDDDIFNLLNFGSATKSKTDQVTTSADKEKIDQPESDEKISISREDNKIQISLIESVEKIQENSLIKSIIKKPNEPTFNLPTESKDDKVGKVESLHDKVEKKCLLNESVIDEVELIFLSAESEIPTPINKPEIITASTIDQIQKGTIESKILPSNKTLVSELPTKTSEIIQEKKLSPAMETLKLENVSTKLLIPQQPSLDKSKTETSLNKNSVEVEIPLNLEKELPPLEKSKKETPLDKNLVDLETPLEKIENIPEKDLTTVVKTDISKPLITTKTADVQKIKMTATSENTNLPPTASLTKTVLENQLVLSKESKSKETFTKHSNSPETKITSKSSIEEPTAKMVTQLLEKQSIEELIVKASTKDEKKAPVLKTQTEDGSTKLLENTQGKPLTHVEGLKEVEIPKKILSVQPSTKTKDSAKEIPVTQIEEPKSSIVNKPTKEEQITRPDLVTIPPITKSIAVTSSTQISGKVHAEEPKYSEANKPVNEEKIYKPVTVLPVNKSTDVTSFTQIAEKVQEKLLEDKESSKKNMSKQGTNPNPNLSATNVDSLKKPLALLEEPKTSIAKNYSKDEKIALIKPPILEPPSKVLGKPEEQTALIVKATQKDKKPTQNLLPVKQISPSIGKKVSPKTTNTPQEKPLTLVNESKLLVAEDPNPDSSNITSNEKLGSKIIENTLEKSLPLVKEHKSPIKKNENILKQNLSPVSKVSVVKPTKIVETPQEKPKKNFSSLSKESVGKPSKIVERSQEKPSALGKESKSLIAKPPTEDPKPNSSSKTSNVELSSKIVETSLEKSLSLVKEHKTQIKKDENILKQNLSPVSKVSVREKPKNNLASVSIESVVEQSNIVEIPQEKQLILGDESKSLILKAPTEDTKPDSSGKTLPLVEEHKSSVSNISSKIVETALEKSLPLVKEHKSPIKKDENVLKQNLPSVSKEPSKIIERSQEKPLDTKNISKKNLPSVSKESVVKALILDDESKSLIVKAPTEDPKLDSSGKTLSFVKVHKSPIKKDENVSKQNLSSVSKVSVVKPTKIVETPQEKPLTLVKESKSLIAKAPTEDLKPNSPSKTSNVELFSKILETALGKSLPFVKEHKSPIKKEENVSKQNLPSVSKEPSKIIEKTQEKPLEFKNISKENLPSVSKESVVKPLILDDESKSLIVKTPTENSKPDSSGKTLPLVKENKSPIKKDENVSKQNLSSVSKVSVAKPTNIFVTPHEKPLTLVKESKSLIAKAPTEDPKPNSPSKTSTIVETALEKTFKEHKSPIKKYENVVQPPKTDLPAVSNIPLIESLIKDTSTKTIEKVQEKPKSSISTAAKEEGLAKQQLSPVTKVSLIKSSSTKTMDKPDDKLVETTTKNDRAMKIPLSATPIENIKEKLVKDEPKASVKEANVSKKNPLPVVLNKPPIDNIYKKDEISQIKAAPMDTIQNKDLMKPKIGETTLLKVERNTSNVKSSTVTSKKIEDLKRDKLAEVKIEKLKPKTSQLPDNKIVKSVKEIAPSLAAPMPESESAVKIISKKIENIADSKSAEKIQTEANLKQSTIKPSSSDKPKQNQNLEPTKADDARVVNLEIQKAPVQKISVKTKPIKTDEVKKSPVKIVDETAKLDKSVKTNKVFEREKVQPGRSVKQKPHEIEKSQIVPKVQSSKSAKPSSVKISSSESELKKIETISTNIISEPKVKETDLSMDKQKELSKTQPNTIKDINASAIKDPFKIVEETNVKPKIVENITTSQIISNDEATIKTPDQHELLPSKFEKPELQSTSRKRKNDKEETTTNTSDENVDTFSKKQKIEKPEPETIKPSLRNRKSSVTEIVKKQDDPIDDVEMKIVSSIVSKTKPQKSDEKKPSPVKSKTNDTKKRRTDVDSSLILENTGENEPPVRQSRRIAQLKIREEAERRNLEEMVLKKMKEESKKKKKEEGIDVKPGELTHSESDSGSDSKKSIKKKTPKKKKDGTHPWNNSDTSDTEHEEEEEEDGLEYRDEELPPLKSDHEFSPESDLEDEIQVIPTKRARTVKKEESEEEESDDSPIHACQKCNKHDHPEWILLCDTCDKGYHCSCLTPVLFIIPEGDWFCPLCQHEKLIENLNIQLEELDKILHQRELEKQRRERIAYTSISLENMVTEKKKNRSKAIKEESSSEESSDDNSSDSDEPIYKLRKRKQNVLSYNFNEYDDLINSAIKQDVKEEFSEQTGAGNLGRGKDISTIIEAGKEEQLRHMEIDESPSGTDAVEQKSEIKEVVENKSESESDDSEPIRPIKKLKIKKKHRKLNSLDIESDDDSDDDFKAKISSNDSEEDENYSGSDSESSLDNRWSRKKKKNNARPVRERRKRFERKFINDGESDESFEAPKKKKKKREDSDFSDFNEDDDDDDEEEELDVDSDELCDDTDSSNSNTAWKPSKKSKEVAKVSKPKSEIKPSAFPKNKIPKLDEDTPFKSAVTKTDQTNEEDGDIRRTRGKKITYLEDYDDESSDDGIKPGVKRPDTPPEERELFIKKQEEIKRMLAAKNTNAALMIAAPTQIHNAPKMPETNLDSISAVPLHVIQNAKALDADYHQRTKPTDDDEFDDLPEDFNPEDMDEEQIAKMMEEEDFAQKQLKLAGEAIRNKKLKEAEIMKRQAAERSLNNSVELDPNGLKLTKAGLEPKKRGRKSKSELQAIADARSKLEGQFSPLVLASQIPQDGNIPFSPNLQQGPSTSIIEPSSHIDHHNIPTTVFAVQGNLGQTEQTALLSSSNDESPLKKRGRRKKITPLRESLRPINFTELNTPISQMKPELMAENKSTTVLSDRLSVSPDSNKLAVAAPPQLYTPGAGITPSVITRLQRPSIPSSFNSQGPPRFFAPMGGSPHMMRSLYPASVSGRPMQSSSPNVLSANGSPDIVMQPGVNFDQRIRHSHGPHAIFRPSTTMYVGHGYPNPSNLHHGLQPVNTPTTTEIGIRGSAPQRDFHGPYLGASYGGFYPAAQLAIPANTTGVTPPPSSSSSSSYEQFETLKTTTAEPEIATPRTEEETGTTGTSEFSGLVSYFSSQHDDLET